MVKNITNLINEINMHCKRNNYLIILNKNNLISRIIKNKQQKMKNLHINIVTKMPEDTTLDEAVRLVGNTTLGLDHKNTEVAWELKEPKEEFGKILRKEPKIVHKKKAFKK